MELVKVAGAATIIHQTIPRRKSRPRPLTRFDTSLPSSSATYRLISVLTTRNIECTMSILASLLLAPGITILRRRNMFRKNSRLSSTLGFFADGDADDEDGDVVPSGRGRFLADF